MEFRRTLTKKWFKNLNLEHLSDVFEITDIDGNFSEAEDGGDSRKKPALDLHALAEAPLKMLEED